MRARYLTAFVLVFVLLIEGCAVPEAVAPLINQFLTNRGNNPATPGAPGAPGAGTAPGTATPAGGTGGALEARQPGGLPAQQAVSAGGGIGTR